MIWAVIGLLLGIIVGIGVDFPIPLEWTRYTAVIIIGMLDALFGAIKASMNKDEYNTWIFFTGLVFNILLALGITFLGDKMGLDLYLAATFVFTFRIFSNLGATRRVLLEKWFKKKGS
jgi:small basic protein